MLLFSESCCRPNSVLYLWCVSGPLELSDIVASWQRSKLDSQWFWWSCEDRLQHCQGKVTKAELQLWSFLTENERSTFKKVLTILLFTFLHHFCGLHCLFVFFPSEVTALTALTALEVKTLCPVAGSQFNRHLHLLHLSCLEDYQDPFFSGQ